MNKLLKISCYILTILLFTSCTLNRVHDLEVSEISKIVFSMESGETVQIETVWLSDGSNPVLHLLESNSGVQVAYDDNSGEGLAAKITYTSQKSQKYILIVRSKSEQTSGTSNLLKDVSLWQIDLPFGGAHLKLGSMSKGEVIETIKPPNGPNRHIVLVMNNSKTKIIQVVEGSYHSQYKTPSKVSCQKIIFGGIESIDLPNKFSGDKLRVYVNDAQLTDRDKDNDGIGDGLEKAIGTCSDLNSTVKGRDGEYFDCYFAADPKDTDGDGLSDGNELLGKRVGHGDVFQQLPLPTWGSDPRHKDYFLEVDFMRRTQDENDNQTIHKMWKSSARNFAKIFADSFETSPFFQLYNARVLRNPDGKPGIDSHLDIGIAPATEEDLGKYGDWGGYTAVNAIQNENGDWEGVNRNTAWKDHMDPYRRGIFKYSLGVSGGRGQCGIGAFSCVFNFHNLNIPAHETGHSLGIGHSGIAYHYGMVDPNCNPAYLSIMNYVYQNKSNMGFSSRPQYAPLNNYEVEEWEAVSPSLPFFKYLSPTFKYYVDPIAGHVDWNRDGIFSPKGSKVKAYINYAPGTGCEYTRYNQMKIPGAETDKAPVLAKLKNKLYLFYKPLAAIGAIKYQTSISNWDCPVPLATDDCNNGTWSDPDNALLGTKDGFDIVKIGSNSNQRLLLVSNWLNGFLWFSELSINADGTENWSPVNLIHNSTKAVGQPSLAIINSNKVMLSYKGNDDVLRYRYYQRAGAQWIWTDEQIATTNIGASITMSDGASPSLIYIQLEWNNNQPTMYGAFATGITKRLDIWAFDTVANNWIKTTLLENSIFSAVGKPEMVWIPAHDHLSGLGRLYLIYGRKDGSRTLPKMLISYHKVNLSSGDRNQTIGLESFFDNSDYSSLGFDIFYDSDDPDGNLKYAGVFPDNAQQIYFRPKANALNDFTYYNLNDWETMGNVLCIGVVNPGNTVNDPIICHDALK